MWWTISILFVIGLVGLWFWLKQQKVKTTWYDLVISILGTMLIFWSAHNYTDFQAEYERVAALNSLIIFGIPGLVLLLLAVFFIWLRLRSARKLAGATKIT